MPEIPAKQNEDRVSLRIDHQQRLAAQRISRDLGTDLNTVINIFLAQLIKENGLPFRPTNNSTMVSDLDVAMAELRHPESFKDYTPKDALQHLDALKERVDD